MNASSGAFFEISIDGIMAHNSPTQAVDTSKTLVIQKRQSKMAGTFYILTHKSALHSQGVFITIVLHNIIASVRKIHGHSLQYGIDREGIVRPSQGGFCALYKRRSCLTPLPHPDLRRKSAKLPCAREVAEQ